MSRHTLPPTSSYSLAHVMEQAEQGFVWAANELRDRGVATVEDVRRMDATLARMRAQDAARDTVYDTAGNPLGIVRGVTEDRGLLLIGGVLVGTLHPTNNPDAIKQVHVYWHAGRPTVKES